MPFLRDNLLTYISMRPWSAPFSHGFPQESLGENLVILGAEVTLEDSVTIAPLSKRQLSLAMPRIGRDRLNRGCSVHP